MAAYILLLLLSGEHLHTKIPCCNEVGINFCTVDLWPGIICEPTPSVPAESSYCFTLEGFVSQTVMKEAEHYGKLRTKYSGLIVSNKLSLKNYIINGMMLSTFWHQSSRDYGIFWAN